MAITYKQAVEFMNGPIGSQIPYVARVLRPSNWNNLNGGLKAKYLGEIEKAINDPVKFSLEKLREAVSQYVVYSNIGGKTGKAEAADYKANIDKYVPFLQSQGQSVDDITSVINKGSLAGVERLAEHEKRINEVSPIDKVVDVAERFIVERNRCTFYRIVGTVNSAMSNPLFNLNDGGPLNNKFTWSWFNTYDFLDNSYPRDNNNLDEDEVKMQVDLVILVSNLSKR